MMRAFLAALPLCLAFLAGSAWGATVIVRATGIESAQGLVAVGLCDKSFEERECPFGERKPARPGVVEFRFADVPPGSYAVAVYHDRNGNGRLDRLAIGLPSEPYGFSRDIGRTSIPTFAAAVVPVAAPSTVITVPVR